MSTPVRTRQSNFVPITTKKEGAIRRKLVAILMMSFLASTALVAQAVNLRSVPGAEKIQAKLLNKMEAAQEMETMGLPQGKGPDKRRPKAYRIIVTLKTPPGEETQSMDYRSNEGLARIQQRVKALQDAVLRAGMRGYLKILHRFQNIYGFSAEADREAILDLVKIGDVKFVAEPPVLHKMDAESLPLTNTDVVHDIGYTGKGVTIAIIDDGIDHDHPAFDASAAWPNEKIIGGYDFADNDNDPRIDCATQIHGTAVAGVAAGNGGGVTGTAPDAKLVFLKVQGESTCGAMGLDGLAVLRAIDWVVGHHNEFNIKIISMSLGGGYFTSTSDCDDNNPSYRNIINAAHAAGIIVLAAAGNDGYVDALESPACLSNVMSVGATYDANIGQALFRNCSDDITDTDLVTCYSNSAEFLDILAPSHCALTAKAGGGTDTCFGGTSSATPFAAGIAAALLEAAGGNLDNDDMRSLLIDNGVEILDHRNNMVTPRIDAEASLQALLSRGDDEGDGVASQQLENDVPVVDLAANTGEERHFTMDVPAGVRNLTFSIANGTGDADLYVKFGSQPTITSYDCRPYLNGNDEACSFPSPSPGTWYVMLQGYDTFDGVTLVGRFSEAPCIDCEHYTGSLLGRGYATAQPNGTYYFSFAGTHQGWLEGPTGSNFDLELYQWSIFGWWKVAQAVNLNSSEFIEYVGASGYYFWRVVSRRGNGNYDFWLQRP